MRSGRSCWRRDSKRRKKKEQKEKLVKRHDAQHKEEREYKLERVHRAKIAMEENPNVLRKGK
jgi:hypothetical protein